MRPDGSRQVPQENFIGRLTGRRGQISFAKENLQAYSGSAAPLGTDFPPGVRIVRERGQTAPPAAPISPPGSRRPEPGARSTCPQSRRAGGLKPLRRERRVSRRSETCQEVSFPVARTRALLAPQAPVLPGRHVLYVRRGPAAVPIQRRKGEPGSAAPCPVRPGGSGPLRPEMPFPARCPERRPAIAMTPQDRGRSQGRHQAQGAASSRLSAGRFRSPPSGGER
jgi:hypothetical protein